MTSCWSRIGRALTATVAAVALAACSDGGATGDGGPVAPALEPPVNPFLADSPWPMAHQGPAQQASSALPGPENGDVVVQLVDFEDDAGIERPYAQTSPFLILSDRRYSDAPEGRTVWAASLTDVYKYALVDGVARYVDHQPIRSNPFSILWNLLTLDGGRVVVPSPLGSDLVDEPCRTEEPAFFVFADGEEIDSPMRCVHRLTAGPEQVAPCRGPDGQPIGPVGGGYSVTSANVLFSGEVITYFRLPTGPGGQLERYLAVAEPDLSGWADCAFLSFSDVTNNTAVEPLSDGRSAIYAASAESMVKFVWDPESRRLDRRWERFLPLRTRTGTTPTLVGYGEDEFVVVVDAPCAVVNPFTGEIQCSPDDRLAQVVAVRRDDDRDEVHTADLPAAIRTVENSPSARGYQIVVAAYGGYDPDPSVRGVASVRWNPDADRLELAWFNGAVQMNGVTSISEGSGLVYSSGVEAYGSVHLSGIRVWDSEEGAAGERVVDVRVAGPEDVDRAFDQGNSTVIADDRTLLWATAEGFVVVRPR